MAGAMAINHEMRMSLTDVEIHRDDVIGRGGFGEVYRGYHIKQGIVAVKMLTAAGAIPTRHINNMLKEADRLRESTSHPNIINVLGVIMEPNNYGLVLEYMHLGSSSTFVKDYKVERALKLRLICQVIEAMVYLHARNPPVLHLDLKADNVLVDKDLNAKICDFGLSEWKTVTTTMTQSAPGGVCPRRCTITHIAPEILKNINAPSTKALDVYAFGVTIWEICSEQTPFESKGNDLIRQSVLSNQRPDMMVLGTSFSLPLKKIILKCWTQVADNRPEFTAVKDDMLPVYQAYESGLNRAIKSIRKQITENFAPNDDTYFGTDHLDNLVYDGTDDDLAESSAVAMETDQSVGDPTMASPELSLLPPTRVAKLTRTPVPPSLNCCRYREPSQLHFPNKMLTADDLAIRKVLLNPLAMELLNSGQIDMLGLSPRAQRVFRSLESLHEYINGDSELLMILLRANSPFLREWNSPKSRDATLKGEMLQQEKKLDGMLKCLNPRTRFRNVDGMDKREMRRYERYRATHRCRYAWRKLNEDGRSQKLLKVLRSPGELKQAMREARGGMMGGMGRFSMMEPEVLDALKDPIILQILLTVDMETRDYLMTECPELVMWLLSENKTDYLSSAEQAEIRSQIQSASGRGGPETKRLQERLGLNEPYFYGGRHHGLLGRGSGSMRHDQPSMGSNTHPAVQTKKKTESEGLLKRFGNSVRRLTGHSGKTAEEEDEVTKVKEVNKAVKEPKVKEANKSVKEPKVKEANKNVKESKVKESKSVKEFKREEEKMSISEIHSIIQQEQHQRYLKFKQEEKTAKPDSGTSNNTARKQTAARTGSLDAAKAGYQLGYGDSRNRNTVPKQMDSSCAMSAARANKTSAQTLNEISRMRISVPLMENMSMDQPPSDTSLSSDRGSRNPGSRNPASPSVTEAAMQGASPLPPRTQPSPRAQPQGPRMVPPEPRDDGRRNVKKETEKEKSHLPDDSKKSRKSSSDGASASKPTTIQHKHAGGGFTHITLNPGSKMPPNMQIGNRMTMVVNNNANDDSDDDDHKPVKKHKKKVKLPKSEKLLSGEQLDTIANEIGKDWRRLCREMGLREPEIEQLNEDFHINGIYEIAYQAIQRWIQRNSRAATVRLMGQYLDNIDRADLIKKLF